MDRFPYCSLTSSFIVLYLIAQCIELIDKTDMAQVAIFVSSMAALERVKMENPETIANATVAMGLSLGTTCSAVFLAFRRS